VVGKRETPKTGENGFSAGRLIALSESDSGGEKVFRFWEGERGARWEGCKPKEGFSSIAKGDMVEVKKR